MKKYTFAICLCITRGILFAQKNTAIKKLSAAVSQERVNNKIARLSLLSGV